MTIQFPGGDGIGGDLPLGLHHGVYTDFLDLVWLKEPVVLGHGYSGGYFQQKKIPTNRALEILGFFSH